ncbi:uncharacterized protein LOC122529727 isoform X1 [Frieseomelitta varia]|uniref:uncharacterized protein LOC122529727 isoform X1 n=1 Tax=Frieseomelitta varia TaxID=561572 RepID=UPI001CB6A713|nr:uncharacterized protein LOC122529727 isoform X1 [Frieseomelitta varia]
MYSVSLPSFVTSAINGQPKSLDHSANKINALVRNKRMYNEGNDGSKNPLVSYFNGECQADRAECKTRESTEMTHLFCVASIYQADESKGNSQDTELASDNFRHYSIDPVCMSIRVCIFWFLWIMLIVVIVISILSYCCFPSKTCYNSTVNTTNTVSI